MKTKIYIVIYTINAILRSLSLLGIIYIFWYFTSIIQCKYYFKDIHSQLCLNILNPTDVTCGITVITFG